MVAGAEGMKGALFDLNEVRAVFEAAWADLEKRRGKSREELGEWPEAYCFMVDGKMVMRGGEMIAEAVNAVDTKGWDEFPLHFENVHLYFSKSEGWIIIAFTAESPFVFFTEVAS